MRKKREFITGAFYHVTSRTNDKIRVFENRLGRKIMLITLQKAKDKFHFRLANFCIMPTHIHLLIKPENGLCLSVIMQWIKANSAKYWNCIHGSSDHLWGHRYFARQIKNQQEYNFVMDYIGIRISVRHSFLYLHFRVCINRVSGNEKSIHLSMNENLRRIFMEKNFLSGRFILLMLFILALSGCDFSATPPGSGNPTTPTTPATPTNPTTPSTPTDPTNPTTPILDLPKTVKPVLGYGYDITSHFAYSPDIKPAVLDLDKLLEAQRVKEDPN